MTTPPITSDPVPDAARSRSLLTRWRVVAAAAAIVIIADQVTKSLVLALDAASAGRAPTGVFAVHLVRNSGASFGMGSGHPLAISFVVLALTVGVGIAAGRSRSRAAELCWAVVFGGAVGNLADRILRSPAPGRGAVVDWIHVAGYPATFNLADLAIRLGLLALVIVVTTGRPKPAQAVHSDTTARA